MGCDKWMVTSGSWLQVTGAAEEGFQKHFNGKSMKYVSPDQGLFSNYESLGQ